MAANPSLGRVMGYEFGKEAGTDLSRPARPVWAAATRRPDGGVGRSTRGKRVNLMSGSFSAAPTPCRSSSAHGARLPGSKPFCRKRARAFPLAFRVLAAIQSGFRFLLLLASKKP
jgi:hypothetical protein